jgi:hypothetical protein
MALTWSLPAEAFEAAREDFTAKWTAAVQHGRTTASAPLGFDGRFLGRPRTESDASARRLLAVSGATAGRVYRGNLYPRLAGGPPRWG